MDIIIDPEALKQVQAFKNPDQVSFGKTFVPAMITCSFEKGKWGNMHFLPYAKIQIDPAAKVLHYAQEIFEGLKAYKNDKNEVYLFRPMENAKRFNLSAQRMGMPHFPEDAFVKSLELLVKHSSQSFSTSINDAFYLRPFMFGDEPQLGVRPSSTYQYYLIGGPAGNYFSNPSVKVRVEKDSHRASSKGIGSAKTGGNYAASMAATLKTDAEGYDQTLWLDPLHDEYIEELSGMNFFAVINDVITTPTLGQSILHGITRDSILKLAASMGYKVAESRISIHDLFSKIQSGVCSEAFASGTASVLAPIECFKYSDQIATLKYPKGDIALKLKSALQELQTGRSSDQFSWRHQVDLS